MTQLSEIQNKTKHKWCDFIHPKNIVRRDSWWMDVLTKHWTSTWETAVCFLFPTNGQHFIVNQSLTLSQEVILSTVKTEVPQP